MLFTHQRSSFEYETIEGKHIHEILEHGKIVSEVLKVAELTEKLKSKMTNHLKSPKRKLEEIDPGAEPAGAPVRYDYLVGYSLVNF